MEPTPAGLFPWLRFPTAVAVAGLVLAALAVGPAAGADSPASASTSPDSVPSSVPDSVAADSASAESADSVSAALVDTLTLGPPWATGLETLPGFEARYDLYLDAEEHCVRAGADRVARLEAQVLVLEAERLAGGGEVEVALALLDEAIGLLEGQCRPAARE
jgi:hypothetical protein